MDEKRGGKPSFAAAATAVGCFAAVMSYAIVALDAPPHLPMLLGCFAAGLAALLSGSRWEDIERGIVRGISQSLVSLVILMLIGVWIGSGVVPVMIRQGLAILTPRYFLVSTMFLCSVVSMALGSWGTAGTVGLALMGVAHAMGIPPAAAAGAIISGSYFGDKASPLSDTTNLASAVTDVDIFTNVRHMFPVAVSVYLIAGALYTAVGLGYGGEGAAAEGVARLISGLDAAFGSSMLNFLPLVILIACILLKIPSIPSIALGILAAAALGLFVQGTSAAELFRYGFSGYTSNTGDEMMDALLTAGGLEAMMFSVSLIICAMMFGGIMEECGLMEALMAPVFRLIGGRGPGAGRTSKVKIVGATLASCALVNLLLPEQYVAISLPGRMFAAAYDRNGIPRKDLTRAINAGGSATSALVPWNTCGVFMTGVLGVSTYAYAPWAFLNLVMPFAVILATFLSGREKTNKPG